MSYFSRYFASNVGFRNLEKTNVASLNFPGFIFKIIAHVDSAMTWYTHDENDNNANDYDNNAYNANNANANNNDDDDDDDDNNDNDDDDDDDDNNNNVTVISW